MTATVVTTSAAMSKKKSVDVHSVGCRVSRALSEVFGEVWRSLTARLPAHGKVQHHGWRFGLQSNLKVVLHNIF